MNVMKFKVGDLVLCQGINIGIVKENNRTDGFPYGVKLVNDNIISIYVYRECELKLLNNKLKAFV